MTNLLSYYSPPKQFYHNYLMFAHFFLMFLVLFFPYFNACYRLNIMQRFSVLFLYDCYILLICFSLNKEGENWGGWGEN